MNNEDINERDNLSHIRSKIIAETSDRRDMERQSCRNARRENFKRFSKLTEILSVKEFETVCEFFCRSKKGKDLERIRYALESGNEQYVKVLFGKEGVTIYTLIGCLSGDNTSLKIESMHCLMNLAVIGSDDQCLVVIKKAAPYFITSLAANHPFLESLACLTLGNFCSSRKEVCEILFQHHLEEAICKVLSSTYRKAAVAATYVLKQYLYTMPDRIEPVLLCAQSQKLLLSCLQQAAGDDNDTADVGWCLFLACSSKDICRALVNYGLVSICLKSLSTVDRKCMLAVTAGWATALVRALSNVVAAVPEVSVEICYNADVFVKGMSELLRCPFEHLRAESVQLLSNIVNAARQNGDTGKMLLEDSNLYLRLDGALRESLASELRIPSSVTNFDFVNS